MLAMQVSTPETRSPTSPTPNVLGFRVQGFELRIESFGFRQASSAVVWEGCWGR